MYRRTLWAAGTVVALAIAALAIPALASRGAAIHKNVHFTGTTHCASISKTQSVCKTHDSVMGDGAQVQTATGRTAKGLTTTEVTYFGNAKAVSKSTTTLGKPDSQGMLPFTGSGHDIRGTGKLRGLRSSYTYRGVYDPKTTIVHVKVKGTMSYR